MSAPDYATVWKALNPVIVEKPGDITFRAFAEATSLRTARDYGEPFDATSAYGPEHWALMIQEEAGEVAGAVIGMLGMKKRKNHLTMADVGREIADVVAYCACLVIRAGGSFHLVGDTLTNFAEGLRKLAASREVVGWALRIQQCAGDIAGEVNHGCISSSAVRVQVAKVLTACACLAIRCGLDFQEIVRSKFNEVSDRIGSTVKL